VTCIKVGFGAFRDPAQFALSGPRIVAGLFAVANFAGFTFDAFLLSHGHGVRFAIVLAEGPTPRALPAEGALTGTKPSSDVRCRRLDTHHRIHTVTSWTTKPLPLRDENPRTLTQPTRAGSHTPGERYMRD